MKQKKYRSKASYHWLHWNDRLFITFHTLSISVIPLSMSIEALLTHNRVTSALFRQPTNSLMCIAFLASNLLLVPAELHKPGSLYRRTCWLSRCFDVKYSLLASPPERKWVSGVAVNRDKDLDFFFTATVSDLWLCPDFDSIFCQLLKNHGKVRNTKALS